MRPNELKDAEMLHIEMRQSRFSWLKTPYAHNAFMFIWSIVDTQMWIVAARSWTLWDFKYLNSKCAMHLPSKEFWHCSSMGLERLGHCFRKWLDEVMDVGLQHLDLGIGSRCKSNQIKSYQHHASLGDDFTARGSIISSLLLITLRVVAWKGRTDRPTRPASWPSVHHMSSTFPDTGSY